MAEKRAIRGWLAGTLGVLAAVALALIGPMFGDLTGPNSASRAEAEIKAYLAQRDGSYGVAMFNLRDDSGAGVNADDEFPMASMYKLLVMYRVMQEVDAGRISLEAPLTISVADASEGDPEDGLRPGDRVSTREALDKMITVSSNAAAYALARTVGGWEQIRAVPGELGMVHTRFDEYWFSTPNDLRHFFRLLARGELVNAEASRQMRAVLERQKRNDRIPVGLPDHVTVAHKTGELDGVRNDGGIVSGADVDYVLVTMSRQTEPAEALETHAEVSRIVYTAFTVDNQGGATRAQAR